MALCKVTYLVRDVKSQDRDTIATYETYTKARGVNEAGKKTEQKAIAHFESILGPKYYSRDKYETFWHERCIAPLEPFYRG